MSPTHQDLSNDTTFSQIKSHVPVLLMYFTQNLYEFLYVQLFDNTLGTANEFFYVLMTYNYIRFNPLEIKGTGTQDLILLNVVSLERS